MGKLSPRGSLCNRMSYRMMSGLAVVTASALLALGCKKNQPPAAPATPAENTNQVAAGQPPVYQPPTSVVPPAAMTDSSGAPDLKELNRSLLRWILGNRRRPQSFEDFAATAGVTIPPPPAGKKYILGKDMHIQLVDR